MGRSDLFPLSYTVLRLSVSKCLVQSKRCWRLTVFCKLQDPADKFYPILKRAGCIRSPSCPRYGYRCMTPTFTLGMSVINEHRESYSLCQKKSTFNFWAHLCKLHGGLICITFCLSVVCLSGLDRNGGKKFISQVLVTDYTQRKVHVSNW